MLEDFKIELGLAVAIIAIAVIGKVFMSNNNSPEKRRRSQAVEETSKRSKNETKSNVEEMEQAVVKKSELVDGQMKEVPMGEANILVVKDKDQIYAFGNKCSHQGALLKSGVYSNGRVRCPLHGACFNTKTGDIEDFPCVDGIQTFDVQVKNDEVLVSASKDALKNFKRTPKMVKPSPSDKRVVAIVGAGPAGLTCAQTLRQEGYTGRIVMIGKETVLPYDRTKLSKTMASKPEQILLRPPEFYKENGIETILGVAVTEFDAKAKTLTMADGKTMSFDYGVIATGGDPRTLPVPGMDLANIYQLRVPEEANNIINQVDGKKVVIVGTSFIGMEAAACVSKKAASVIAIGMEKVPFERVLGEKVGSVLQKFHEKNGIQFRLQRVVKEFIGKDGKVTQVVLDNGEILEADLCVVGAGIIPATKFVKPGTLEIARDQSIVADKFLKAADDVYVAGDLARFPFFYTGESVRVEHYGYAMYQGKTVALNILGKNAECKSVPFFWTTQYGKAVRYAGHALSYDEILFDGNLDDMSFVGFYVKNNKVLAAVAIGRDPICSAVAELMDAGRMPTADQLKANNFKLTL